ncbi:NuA4 histone acetyltransferase subunit [Coemansia brasiliensis]|uniref:NuA4 histone acetyltransferase subunit n=1 Tax=Coemansia brasiliensis TaxID=2650707 RepID=A0A9W8M0W5_9FUNG|nr:NuA4 histone acetyltransferase subunit [Coemansia brasiliensis]
MPTYGGDEVNAVVLDVGSTWTRAGFAGEDVPRGYFPSHVGRVGDNYYVGDTESAIWRAEMETCGVMKDGVVQDWDVLERLWEHAMKRLHATASEHPLLVSEAAWSSSEQRTRTAELAFEKLGSPAFYTCKAPVMAAFGTGKHTALVLDVGGENTSASAVFEGFNLAKSVCHQPLGGEHVSRQLLDRFKTDYSYEPTPLFDIKHKAAVEIRKPPSITHHGRQATSSFMADMRLRLMLEFKEAVCEVLDRPMRPGQTTSKPPKPFEFPDGFNVAAGPDLRYAGPELLFNPSQYLTARPSDLQDAQLAGVHELVVKSIMACDIDLRPHLLNSIVLAGGSTLFPGFADRLSLALQEMCPGSRVKLHSPSSDMERKTSAWLGGSILASLGTFHQLWISKAEYEEHGSAIVDKKCH